ncbi:DUF5606 family protein [Chitinophaga sancti]|uniref:DUF5606 domain-containing protein n=1 Tax=Chitinophaga sancti TaxID=1004 RepID=A0A1K1NXF8_9BACT|nr:DUF5606 domain-containing protein [Chitinophaga sancti]WQD60272.1 DUF5606 domain-containing protein [Chitinophaga sancti]WQG87600.1 DUF5606 domain-containing protein [Chitinophaga sancti]SFW39955.1 hypothetical protein SAMN05661012_01568 [Chitinophaga sancti]
MQYREIVAVTGLGGLFQLIASKQDGAIVRSLEDKSTRFVSSRIHNFTPLESIEVFTTGENVNLAEVFKAMQEQDGKTALVDAKADNNAVKAYFKSVFPEFDEERVYVSDMKKMVKWYTILKNNDLLKFDEQAEEADTEEVAAETAVVEEEAAKPAKKAAKPKKAAAKDETPAAEGEEAPAAKPKKATKAKKEETPAAEGEEAPKKKAAPKKKKTEE